MRIAGVLKNGLKCQYQSVCKKHRWTSSQIRKTFIDYFVERDHEFVPSSSVTPKKDDGSYFVNSGMNQFKPLFLGTVDKSSKMASYKRVVNYQKCVRIGGKHNDLDDVGRDHYHHTFFEMLGNWSFNDYGKSEACKMAWELLTKVYKIPQEKLFVTYFGGDESLNLMPDMNCKEIWRSIGVPEQRILPFGMRDNFWVMGETGPCGPCTEIHYCHHDNVSEAPGLVNAGDEGVIEIWNLVFVEFDRCSDGTLRPLPQRHIDTGMGLERITALLSNTSSNYDTDLFHGFFNQIARECACAPYGGSLSNPVDRAYRIVADHARMFTVTIGDGVMPGRKESEAKLRSIIYRALYQANEILGAPKDFISTLVPVVVDSLGKAYPNLQNQQNSIMDIIRGTEQRYLDSVEIGRKMMRKALMEFGDVKVLSGDQVLRIQESKFGNGVSYEIISLLAPEFNVTIDKNDYEERMKIYKETTSAISCPERSPKFKMDQHDLKYLRDNGIATTLDRSSEVLSYSEEQKVYKFPEVRGRVVALRVGGRFVSEVPAGTMGCGVILDETPFYAEGGGQVSDVGDLRDPTSPEKSYGKVVDVQKCGGYFLHGISQLENDIKVGDVVHPIIDAEQRTGCMANHSASHIIHFALHRVLGQVRQKGAFLDSDSLTFDFTCPKPYMTNEDLKEVIKVVNEFIRGSYKVNIFNAPLSEVTKAKHLFMLEDEVYPSEVKVVSISNNLRDHKDPKFYEVHDDEFVSLELCGGTHVTSTDHIEEIVISNLEGTAQGTKRITAITRSLARQALDNYKAVESRVDALGGLENVEEVLKEMKQIDRFISSALMPKLDREKIMDRMKEIRNRISQDKHSLLISSIVQLIGNEISKKDDISRNSPLVLRIPFEKSRDAVMSLLQMNSDQPLMLLSESSDKSHNGVVYVPKDFSSFGSKEWADHVCTRLGGKHFPPKGKFAKHDNICLFGISSKGDHDQEASLIIQTAEQFLNSTYNEASDSGQQ